MLLTLLLACTGLRSVVPPVDSDGADSDAAVDSDPPADSDPGVDSDPPRRDTTPGPDDSDPPTDSEPPVDSDPPVPPAWSAALTVDGAWDCPAGAELSTTTPQAAGRPRACVTWTSTHLHVAVQHPDVASPTPSHFLWLYAGAGQGTTTGALYNTQQPGLPRPVDHHLRTKLDASFHSLMTWNGAAWVDGAPGYLNGPGAAVARAGDLLELRVPLADLGVNDRLVLAMGLLFEGAGFESTYAGAPSSAFTDGYDPNLAHIWDVDLTAATPPSQVAPVP